MSEAADTAHVQIKLFTKAEKLSVPDYSLSVPSSSSYVELSAILKQIFAESGDARENAEFDFLINGEFFRVSLAKYLEENYLPHESTIEIEVIEKLRAPVPHDSFLHDDWVSAVRGLGDIIITGCYDHTVHLWNDEGDHLTTIPGHSGPVKCVDWIKQDENQYTFVSGSHDGTLFIWHYNQDQNSVEHICACKGHAGSVDCVAVNAGKNKIASGSWDKMIKIWDTDPTGSDELSASDSKKARSSTPMDTNVPLITFDGHTEGVSEVRWLADAEICSVSWDHTIRLWDLSKAVQKSMIVGPKAFLSMDYSPFNKLIVAGLSDPHVRLFDPRVSSGVVVKTSFVSHRGWVTSVAWSPVDEYLFISGSYDFVVKLWDMRSPKAPLYDMTGHEDKVLSVDWSIPKYIASGSADNTLKLFDASSRKAQ